MWALCVWTCPNPSLQVHNSLACSVSFDSAQPHGLYPPGSSVHGIFQTRILEWVAISVSRGSSWPRDRIPVFCISCLVGGILYHWVWVYYIMLLLSRFSCVQLCATPQTAAHQAPPSLGYSRQEHWSGLPFLSSMQESESEVAQSCPTLSDPMDCSPPGSSIPGILQARVLD